MRQFCCFALGVVVVDGHLAVILSNGENVATFLGMVPDISCVMYAGKSMKSCQWPDFTKIKMNGRFLDFISVVLGPSVLVKPFNCQILFVRIPFRCVFHFRFETLCGSALATPPQKLRTCITWPSQNSATLCL